MEPQQQSKVKKPVAFIPKTPVLVVSGDDLTKQYIERQKAAGKPGVSKATKKNERQPKAKAVAGTKPVALPFTPKKPNAAKLMKEDTKEQAVKQKAADKKKAAKEDPQLELGLAKRTQNRAPTLEAAEQFQVAFDHFNKTLFKGELEDTIIGWEVSKKAAGVFRPDRWAKLRGEPVCHEIGLNPVEHHQRNTLFTLSTLVHEMCHLYVQQSGNAKVKPYHCKHWHKIMLQVGLIPIIIDGKGNPLLTKDGEPKETGKNATHEEDPNGAFMEEYNALLATGFDIVWSRIPDPVAPKSAKPPKPKARVKHVCPKCDEYAVAKREHSLTCKPCKKEMVPDLSDDPIEEESDE